MSNEIGWQYGKPVGKGSECKFCGKIMKAGGVTRLKNHLIGERGQDVSKCPSCPPEVRKQLKELKEQKCLEAMKTKMVKERVMEELREMGGDGDDHEVSRSSPEQERESTEIGASGSGNATKRSIKDFMRRSSSVRISEPTPEHRKYKSDDARQPRISSMMSTAPLREKLGKMVAKAFVFNHIPANVVEEHNFKNMITEAENVGRGVLPPTPKEILGKYLDEIVAEIETDVKKLEPFWEAHGCSLLCDGWTGPTKMSIINFMVYSAGRVVFLDSVDATGKEKNHEYIMQIIEDKIKEVGRKRVVQIVTDNASSYKKAGILLSKKYNLFWTPCVAHCIDLMFEYVAKHGMVKKAVDMGRVVTRFIYNHDWVVDRVRKSCGRDLVRPGATRFATNYLALQSLLRERDGLRNFFLSSEWFNSTFRNTPQGKHVEQIICSPMFWDYARDSTKIMDPMYQVLRVMDTDKYPSMGSVYHAMIIMKEGIKVSSPINYVWVHKIIDQRWLKSMDAPIYKAAYFLNPKYRYKQNLGDDQTLIKAVHEVFDKLLPKSKGRSQFGNKIVKFRYALAMFGTKNAIASRETMWPGEWWKMYGNDAPTLRQLAVKILSQIASASPCERNWSTFALIHTKPRNRLSYTKLKKLVYCHYNMKLKVKKMEAEYKQGGDPHDDPLDYFVLLGENDMDDRENPYAEWIAANTLDEEDGRPSEHISNVAREAGIDVDMATQQILESSSESIHCHDDDPASDMDLSASESNGESNDGSDDPNDDDDGDSGDVGGEGDDGHEDDEEYDDNQGHGNVQRHGRDEVAQFQDPIRYQRRRNHREVQRLQHDEEAQLSNTFSSIDVSSSGTHIGTQGASSSSYGYNYGYTSQGHQESSTSSYGYGYGSYNPAYLYPYPIPVAVPTVTYSYQLYPRIGVLIHVSAEEYDRYVREYMHAYQQRMTWEQYCAYVQSYYGQQY